jgi:cell division GTPase FtsZ
VAKKYMDYMGVDNPSSKVGAIVTLPTHGEANSPLVASNALEMGKKLSAKADKNEISPLIVIDNDKVKRLYKGLTVDGFFPTINSSVAQLLHIFNAISVGSSEYVTFDATDFQSVIEVGGHMIMGVSTVRDFETKTSIADALRKNLMKTLLASDFKLDTAKAAAVVTVGGKQEFSTVKGLMDNIEFGFDAIAAITGKAKVHRGVYSDENRNGKVSVYTLISGLKAPEERYNKIKKNVLK